ncbi:MAG TPA: dienelactone hydrolase family protein [Opitutales bacterium]|jgi:carboxymethylenebutenolidase|nr:dienelactone hydrolase family protein [Opitutales bacterium]
MNHGESDITLRVGDGTTMAAYVARPTGAGPFPGLIVFPEAFGVNAHIRDVCDRFAREGYLAIAPELYHRTAPAGFTLPYEDFMTKGMPHMSAVTPAGLEHDTCAAWDWLQAQPQVRKGAMACIGYCLGGRTAFLANSVKPFAAAVSYYGGGIAQGMLPRAAAQHGPILLFWGGLDTHILPEHTAQVAQALRAAKKPHINVEISFADHGFFCDARATYNAQAAAEAWALTLTFLKENLQGK